MLSPAPSHNIAQDHLTVFYDTNPRAIIALNARLVHAYNPWGAIPPNGQNILAWASLATTADSLANINAALASFARVYDSQQERARQLHEALNDPKAQGAAIGDLANWFAVAGLTTPIRDFLFFPAGDALPPGTGAKRDRTDLAMPTEMIDILAERDGSDGEGWLTPEEEKALAFVTLWISYEKLARPGSLLTAEIEAPKGSSKDLWPLGVRIRRMFAIARALQDSIRHVRLREHVAFLMSPAVAPYLEYLSPSTREEFTNYATQVLALKVHPWIAEAERLRLPARRYTEWGNANITQGLARGEESIWNTYSLVGSTRDGSKPRATDIRDLILRTGKDSLINKVRHDCRTLFEERAMFNPDDLRMAEAELGLTTPSNPPSMHLHGQTWRPLIMTGDMASEALTDPMTALLKPRFPLARPNGASAVSASVDARHYNARYWVSGQNGSLAAKPPLTKFTAVPPLFVQEQRPEFAEGYGLRQITGQMIQAVDDQQYWGDEDAVFEDYDANGAARLMGFPDGASLASSAFAVTSLEHLFRLDPASQTLSPKVKGATRIFHSARTRQPWRKSVPIPTNAIPQQVMAMDQRTAPMTRDVEAVIIVTPEQPAMTASTVAAGDGLAVAAMKGLGYTQ